MNVYLFSAVGGIVNELVYFCDPDQKTSSQDYIFKRIALDVNVLREDTISYM